MKLDLGWEDQHCFADTRLVLICRLLFFKNILVCDYSCLEFLQH